MQYIISISVKDKVAKQTDKTIYVCGNSDFSVVFDFDDEWNEYDIKTARFVHGWSYTDVVFSGNICNVPVIKNTTCIKVGVFAGDLCTTTEAYVDAKKSILCENGVPDAPTPDVYSQIMEKVNDAANDAADVEKQAESGAFNGKDAVVDDTLTQAGQAADAEATGDALAGKLTEPAGIAVGKYFRVAAIDEAGHAVLEAVDAPVGGVQDVKVDGTSIVADGVANVPIAKEGKHGLVSITTNRGLSVTGYGTLQISTSWGNDINERKNMFNPITPYVIDYAVKAAMCDGKGASWTDTERISALLRMGCTVDDDGIVRWSAQEV